MAGEAPTITLTTDFGFADGTVGAMIGVIKSICPAAEVVNLASDVPAHDIRRGAWALYQAVPFFPEGTIHVAVVDPGVGTRRRAILVDTGREYLIGPDNGLLSWAWRVAGRRQAYAIENPSYRISRVGVTFDGRDLFAPAAAHVALGIDPATVGPVIRDAIELVWPEPRVQDDGRIAGEILVVDHFGNMITNIPMALAADTFADANVRVELPDGQTAPLGPSYKAISTELGAVINGSGLIEIAGRERSAHELTRRRPGDRIMLCTGESPA